MMNSIKIILSIIAGVAVGKIASGFIMQINAGGASKYDSNKKKI
ncbi:hypothetical protein [Emticicia sp. C21]|nr:hypothetical protein [Emticicia sp. C21]